MLLAHYKNAGLTFNLNFLEQTSKAGLFAYRGEWVLVEGKVGYANAVREISDPV